MLINISLETSWNYSFALFLYKNELNHHGTIACHNQVLLEKVNLFDVNSGHRITMMTSYKHSFSYFTTGSKLDLVLDVIGD